MKLEWDERKNRANIRKHGLDFADVEQLFAGPAMFRPDVREDYGEERWLGIGLVGGRVAVVAFIDCGSDVFRIISLRRANRRERAEYEKEVKDRLGKN
jgi:uncharacterized DUF497 family protein